MQKQKHWKQSEGRGQNLYIYVDNQ